MSQPEETAHKTCRVTIIQPGMADSVIDVYPAEHEKEKVWMDKNEGTDRMLVIDRIISAGTPREKVVLKAKPWNQPGEKLNMPTLKEEDIPKVVLEYGHVLKAPALEVKPLPVNSNSPRAKAERQADTLAQSNEQLAAANVALMANMKVQQEQIDKILAKTPDGVNCSACGKDFARQDTLDTHFKKFHPGEKDA